MTLKIIADEPSIKKYSRLFIKKFKPFIDEQIKVRLGHQGAAFPAKVLWSKKLGVWVFSRAIKDTRYWNVFGTGKPQVDSLLSITCEINFPWAAIDRKTGGAFARDERGNVFVVHRGKIGGGKKGVGKSLFEHNYRGVWSAMEDGAALSQVAVIGALNSQRFALQIARFVKKIEILKSGAEKSGQTEFVFSEISFRDDLVGDLPKPDEEDLTAACDRELVVHSLAGLLQRWKLKTGNDHERALFLVNSLQDKISHIFEVVTVAGEKNILAAAAKLLYEQSLDEGNPFAILVIPEELMIHYARLLQNINVSVIGFRLEEEKIIFPDLGKIKLDQN